MIDTGRDSLLDRGSWCHASECCGAELKVEGNKAIGSRQLYTIDPSSINEYEKE